MKIKTSELTDAALDWAVANAAGMLIEVRPSGSCGRPLYVLAAEPGRTPWVWSPSTSWHFGGPIIERENIGIRQYGDFPESRWQADTWAFKFVDPMATGPTPLIAAMRCYVASKLGDEINIPEELK